jgi:GNAT superfamily N-acetyltransferase
MTHSDIERAPLLRMQLPDGRMLALRRVATTDTPLIGDLLSRISARSRRLRYLIAAASSPDLIIREAIRISSARDPNYTALVVTGDEAGHETAIAVGELAAEPAARAAELAIVVRDDYQRLGIGTIVWDTLLRAARAQGVLKAQATTLAENEGLLRLVRRMGLPYITTTIYGEMDIVMDLAPRYPARTTTHQHVRSLQPA